MNLAHLSLWLPKDIELLHSWRHHPMHQHRCCRPRVEKTHPPSLSVVEARSSWSWQGREKQLFWRKSWYKSWAYIFQVWSSYSIGLSSWNINIAIWFPGPMPNLPSFWVEVSCFVPWYLARPFLSLYFFTGLKLGFLFFNPSLNCLVILPCQKKATTLELLQRQVRFGVGWL